MTDVIADMLTRIRNAQRVAKRVVDIPHSKEKESIVRVLKAEGYIRDYVCEKNDKGHPILRVDLKYYDGDAVIRRIERVSKPGCRVYSPIKDLKLICGGLGMQILSTSKGVMSDAEARKHGVGGEVVCSVF